MPGHYAHCDGRPWALNAHCLPLVPSKRRLRAGAMEESIASTNSISIPSSEKVLFSNFAREVFKVSWLYLLQ